MKTWAEFISEFGCTPGHWNKTQWKLVAKHFMGEPPRGKRGRPPDPVKKRNTDQNYRALEFWATEKMKDAESAEKSISEKESVRQAMKEAIEITEESKILDRKLIETIRKKLPTAVSAVRKIRAERKKAEPNLG